LEKIVFLDRDAIRATFKRPAFDHEWREYSITPREQVLERLRDATIAITNRVALEAREVEKLPALRFIAVAATGFDCVDTAACQRRGIVVSNVRGWCSTSVPEHVFALVLALRRQIIAYRAAVQRGEWQRSANYCLLMQPLPHDLHGSVLGIIGYGALGQAVARLGQAFGMEVIIAERKTASPRAGRVSFDEALRESDIITLHCPLTDETRNLIGRAELNCMRRTTLLINTSRGGVVDDGELAAALRQGRIAGAGVDVLSFEPPSAGNPLLNLQLPNLIVTPHMAWASVEALQTLADQVIGNLEAFVQGAPRNVVTV